MGRYYWSKKKEADGLKQVSVSFLKKHGYFSNGWHSGTVTWSRNGEETGNISFQSSISEYEQYVRFIYTQTDRYTGEKNDFDYRVQLATTPCYFGGKRYWFTCSASKDGVYCGRRAGVLYLGGKIFACRHCYDLTYNSRNLSGISKTAGRVISMPELEKLESEVRRKYYSGKMTRRYERYLKKQEKADRQMIDVARLLGGDNIY
jgi:hypothetical protein